MKTFKIFILLLFFQLQSYAVDKYLVSGGTGNYNSTTNWSLTDGGLSGAPVPSSSDNVYLTAASSGAGLTVNVSSAALSFICTGYTGTLTVSSGLTVSGSVTLGSGMTIAGTNILTINGAANLLSNGKVWSGGLTLNAPSLTVTFDDNWTISGSFVNQGNNVTINGSIAYIGGNYTWNNGSTTSSTTQFSLNGTGTWSGVGSCSNSTTINTTGVITITSANFRTGTLTYTSGTTITAGGTLNIPSNAILNTDGLIWNNITLTAAGTTVTLTGNLIVSGALTSTGSTNASKNAFTAAATKNISLSQGGTQDLSYVNFTNIAATGKTLCTYKGTITTCTNVRLLPTEVQTISY